MAIYFELTPIPKFLNPSIPQFRYFIQCRDHLVNKKTSERSLFLLTCFFN
jgi:hypothetical protein